MLSKKFGLLDIMRPVLWAALLWPVLSLAHGESAPGPNGGEIRMPGAFHLEAIAGQGAVYFYLLDMEFKNPQVSDSSVSATLRRDGDEWSLECSAADDGRKFQCELPAGVDLTSGRLRVDATRSGVPGAAAQYDLPLIQEDEPEDAG